MNFKFPNIKFPNIKLTNFKLNVSILASLILVILLCQFQHFVFLTNTMFGRLILTSIVILITYFNKMLGLLSVLAIIIAYNINELNVVQSYNYYEGFENTDSSTSTTDLTTTNNTDLASNDVNIDVDDTTTTDGSNNKIMSSILEDKVKILKAKEDILKNEITALNKIQQKQAEKQATSQEGFCMSDKELNILRGKQSNSVPVFNKYRQQNNIEPSDNSLFSSFSSFY